MRVLSIFGTRPDAIKMAPVVRALQEHADLHPRVCVTAQHRGMLDPLLDELCLEAHHDLSVMRPGQDLYDVTSRVLVGLRAVLQEERPDAVLVHGDTTTALAATLASLYARVPVGHVEAGLRTGDLDAPWPEEANRALVDRVSRWHFAPTERARAALLGEGIEASRVHVTGNTVIDALLWMRDRVRERPTHAWAEALGGAAEVVGATDLDVVLVTAHRRESFGRGLQRICDAVERLARRNPDVHVVYPVHVNPNVDGPVRQRLAGLDNVHLLRPLGYGAFVRLMDRCTLILTDSGGIQEEAPSLGKPVLVLRDTTERPECVEAGTARLVGTDPARIVAEAERLLADRERYAAMQRAHNPFGDGRAARRIAAVLASSSGDS